MIVLIESLLGLMKDSSQHAAGKSITFHGNFMAILWPCIYIYIYIYIHCIKQKSSSVCAGSKYGHPGPHPVGPGPADQRAPDHRLHTGHLAGADLHLGVAGVRRVVGVRGGLLGAGRGPAPTGRHHRSVRLVLQLCPHLLFPGRVQPLRHHHGVR